MKLNVSQAKQAASQSEKNSADLKVDLVSAEEKIKQLESERKDDQILKQMHVIEQKYDTLLKQHLVLQEEKETLLSVLEKQKQRIRTSNSSLNLLNNNNSEQTQQQQQPQQQTSKQQTQTSKPQVNTKVVPVCKYFLAGKCLVKNCPFKHTNDVLCKFFLNGFCS